MLFQRLALIFAMFPCFVNSKRGARQETPLLPPYEKGCLLFSALESPKISSEANPNHLADRPIVAAVYAMRRFHHPR